MALEYVFVDSNEYFLTCVQQAGKENIKGFFTFDEAKVGQRVFNDLGVWKSVREFDPRICDYIVFFSEECNSIYEFFYQTGVELEHVASYEYFMEHLNGGVYYSATTENKIVEVIHQLSAKRILDWDLFFAKGIRLSLTNDFFGNLEKGQIDGKKLEKEHIFPLQEQFYENILEPEELLRKRYDVVLFTKYRTFKEYEQCLSMTQDLSRYTIIQLRDRSEAARALMASDLSQWGCYLPIASSNGSLLLLDKKKQRWVTMYVVTHKEFQLPECEDIYVPIQAGSSLHESLGFLQDNTGDNISDLNPLVNEITALYWIWKHDTSPYVGLVHYRRYFIEGEYPSPILQEDTALKLLHDYDILVVDEWAANGLVKGQLIADVGKILFDQINGIIEAALEKYQPLYCKAYRYVMCGHGFYRCNMFVTSHEICDAYCKWLFSFILEVVKKVDLSEVTDAYAYRAIAFFCERLLTVWLMQQHYKIKELHIIEMK